MEKLQNNFTTPEQSKRLLELGVPADSSDCALVRNLYFPKGNYDVKVLDCKYSRFIEMHDTWEIIPCWSAGRLMEIYVIARGLDTAYLPIERGEDMVKYLIRLYEEKKDLDFSKLEDYI